MPTLTVPPAEAKRPFHGNGSIVLCQGLEPSAEARSVRPSEDIGPF
jgi:hypothetical protein